jgi:ferric-dicitrate binding protein FerR (iron transport regulator)
VRTSRAVETAVGKHQQLTAVLEAAEWFVRLGDDHMSMQDRLRYLDWLKSSPIHVAETLRLVRLDEALRSNLLGATSRAQGQPIAH